MKLLEITILRAPSKIDVIQVGSVTADNLVSFEEASSIIEEAANAEDTDVLKALKFSFCIHLDGKAAQSLIIRSIMPFPTDLLIKEKKIEFTVNGWQLREILRRWLVMDNIYLKKMGGSMVLDLVDRELIFLVRDILDRINKGGKP